MNIKHAKKFLGIIWIIIIGLMMGFIYGWYLDQKKTAAENSTELSDYDVIPKAKPDMLIFNIV